MVKWFVAIAAWLGLPVLALAGAAFTLTAGGTGVYGPTEMTVNVGDSFTIDLGISQEDSIGCTLFGGALEASTSDVFYLTSRSFSLNGTYYEAVADSLLLHDDNKWLSPQSLNFGALRFDFPMVEMPIYWSAADFPSVVSTFTLQTAADAPPGVYTITTGEPGGGIYIADWQGSVAGQLPLTVGTIQVTIKNWPAVTSAISVKTHGDAGDFAIDVLNRIDDQDIEGRKDGVTRLVVGFDMDIQRINGGVTDVSLSSGTVSNITKSAADHLTIEMSDSANGAPLIVSFPGIANASDISAVSVDSVCIRQLAGDVRPDLTISAADRVDVRDGIGKSVTSENFRADVRANGSINAADRVDVRDAMGTGFVGACP